MLVDECHRLKHQIVSGSVRSGEMIQRLANASKDVDGLIDDLNSHATPTQKAV